VRERITAAAGMVCALSSYRHIRLIAALNELLAPVSAARPTQPGRGSAVRRWMPIVAVPIRASRRRTSSCTWRSAASDGALARAAAALAAPGRARRKRHGLRRARAGDPARPLDYGDIGVLCRASTSFAAHEDAFGGRRALCHGRRAGF
jgi:hypothetical protein